MLCILDHAPILGGAERFALRLATEALRLDAYDHVAIVCPHSSSLADIASGVCQVIPTEFPDPALRSCAAIPAALVALRRIVSELQPNAIVANTARCHLYAGLALLRSAFAARLIQLAHEQDSADRVLLRSLYRRAGRLEVIGYNARMRYSDCLSPIEVSQVNNFLTADEFMRLGALPASREPGERPPVIGCLSRMIPAKGIVELVEALAVVRPDCWSQLRIAAISQDIRYENRLRSRIAELELGDRALLTGPVSDVGLFLADLDIVIVPSTGTEGQPTVILEALAAGRRVLVRRPLYSPDYAGLPVSPYDTPLSLEAALQQGNGESVDAALLRQRFGAGQVLAAINRGLQADQCLA